MAYTSNDLISSSQIIDLKNRVRAEMNRRCHDGSVAAWGSGSWDFSSNPTPDNPITADQIHKIVNPLHQINNVTGYPSGTQPADNPINNLSGANTMTSVLSIRQITDRSGTDCRSGCTGTCYSGCTTSCYTGCTSCSGCTSCTSCSGGCSGCSGCSGSCRGSCRGCKSCSGGCQGCPGCAGGCRSAR